MKTRIKTATEIVAMRTGGSMLASVLQKLKSAVEPEMTTKQLADIAARELKALGGIPSFLGYHGFPDVICISVNEAIVHGIPGKRVLQDGDIVGLDFGVTHGGLIVDGAISVAVGNVSREHQTLLDVTEQSLAAGIEVVQSEVQVGDISGAIEQYIRKAGLYGIPRDLVGHGVGDHLWEEPNIPNYGRAGVGPRLSAGMTVAIEPMVTLGTAQIKTLADGWTIVTTDGSWAAHFEHTVLITETGYDILTK